MTDLLYVGVTLLAFIALTLLLGTLDRASRSTTVRHDR